MKAAGEEVVTIFSKGGECGEAAQKAGNQKREQRTVDPLTEKAKNIADEEAAQNIADKNSERETIERSALAHRADSEIKREAAGGSTTAAEEDQYEIPPEHGLE